MLPDFINHKSKLNKYVRKAIELKIAAKAPLYNAVKKKQVYEGNRATYTTIDGELGEYDFKPAQSEVVIQKDEIKDIKLPKIVELIDSLADDMAKQIEQGMFAKIDETTTKTGNVFNNNGKPLSIETFLEVLKKMPLDFEEGDPNKPIYPTIVASPEVTQKFYESVNALSPDEQSAFREEETQLLKVKYEEYTSRENNRKLVD